MRDIIKVVKEMKGVIPRICDKKFDILKNQMDSLLDTLFYTAPEILNSKYYWSILQSYVNESIKESDCENNIWVQNFIDIFTGNVQHEP